jgi:hypothetical protein
MVDARRPAKEHAVASNLGEVGIWCVEMRPASVQRVHNDKAVLIGDWEPVD